MHCFLYFRKQIWVQAHRSMHEQPDIHARLMARYPQGVCKSELLHDFTL